MLAHKILAALLTVCLTAPAPLSAPNYAATRRPLRVKVGKSAKSKPQRPNAARNAGALLWRQPAEIEGLDLFYGAGGKEGAPNPAGRFTYVSGLKKGTAKKMVVADEQERRWVVKVGPEARTETAATRILWAAGYHVDQDYFVKRARVTGGWRGDLTDARFERFEEALKGSRHWSWRTNPFAGSRELEGLKVLMALLNNWDLKDVNNSVFRQGRSAEPGLSVYYVSDLGATLGSTGSFLHWLLPFTDVSAGSKGVPKDYARQRFIDGIKRGFVDFHYKGKNPSALKGVRVESARWMGELLGKLSDRQLSDAFRAGGYNAAEVAAYVQALRNRINQLRSLG